MCSRAGLIAAAAALAIAFLATGAAQALPPQRLPALAPAPNDGLTRALAAGRLSEGAYALERATALFAPRRVARRFGPIGSMGPRGATLVLRDLAARLPLLRPDQRARAESLLARPDAAGADPGEQGYSVPAAPPVCTEHFCLHYVTTTADAPPAVDADGNGIPDEVDLTAQVLEQVWQKEVDEYGFRPPKSDLTSTDHGPDAKVDVYLADVGSDSLYGYCTTDDPGPQEHPRGPYDVSAYCVLDNDYSPAQFASGASGAQALEVTAAHEFFHAIQFGYDFVEDRWLLEGTAVWMEDEVYDDINDNYQYLDVSQLRNPAVPLDLGVPGQSSPLAGFQYGAFVFWRYLSESTGGPGIIRRIWELADGSTSGPDQYSLQATDSALRGHGTTARAAFARFAAVNAFPATFYREGAAYPHPSPSRRLALTPRRPSASGTALLDHLTSWYGVFRAGAGSGATPRARLTLALPRRARGSEATLVVVPVSGSPRLEPLTIDTHGDGARTIPLAPANVKEVELVLSNASGRLRCWVGSPFSCQGQPLDDSLTFRYALRLIGPAARKARRTRRPAARVAAERHGPGGPAGLQNR